MPGTEGQQNGAGGRYRSVQLHNDFSVCVSVFRAPAVNNVLPWRLAPLVSHQLATRMP